MTTSRDRGSDTPIQSAAGGHAASDKDGSALLEGNGMNYSNDVETPMTDQEVFLRAKLVAKILTERGLPTSSPDCGTLDDVERERWETCIEIVSQLNAWRPPRQPRYLPDDIVPKDFTSIEADRYPLCPDCGAETGLISRPATGRAWNCMDCGWEGESYD